MLKLSIATACIPVQLCEDTNTAIRGVGQAAPTTPEGAGVDDGGHQILHHPAKPPHTTRALLKICSIYVKIHFWIFHGRINIALLNFTWYYKCITNEFFEPTFGKFQLI